MANVLVNENSLSAIASAIRTKNGTAATYKPAQMSAAILALPQKEDFSWNQCSQLVRDYLAYITANPYNPNDYSYSVIQNFAPATAVSSNAKPIGYTVDGTTFYNNVPNVATPYATASKAGTLTALDGLRWINTTAGNVRDLGGWSCDGGTVKYGKLIRGGQCSASDRTVLVNECGIRVDLNLRGREEAGGATTSPLGTDIIFYLFDGYAWYSISNTTLWRQMIRAVFDSVARNEPVYFHCAAGADRTATLACVLEALLGMSQGDIDADYELTCFYSGTGSDASARRRNETDWQGLINAINAKAGTTFRDKAVMFIAELGFTADEINAFRSAMIDGTPETVTPQVNTYTVTNTLTNVTSDNPATFATQYQSYEADITPITGNAINSVVVTMGGVDITSQVFSGTQTNFYNAVTQNLVNCTSDNGKIAVINGQGYGATITANDGYTLEGATVQITMGGVDVSTYYSNGKIAIPSVTGNIIISITAVPSAPTRINAITSSLEAIDSTAIYNGTGYNNDKRLNSSASEVEDNGSFITGFIPVKNGDVIKLYGGVISGGKGGLNTWLYNSSGTHYKQFSPNTYSSGNTPSWQSNVDYDSSAQVLHGFTINEANAAYIRFTCVGNFVDGETVITINE